MYKCLINYIDQIIVYGFLQCLGIYLGKRSHITLTLLLLLYYTTRNIYIIYEIRRYILHL